jgi:hypothetical protein
MTSRQQKNNNIIPAYSSNDRDHLPYPIDEHQFTQQQSSPLFTQAVAAAAANITTATDDGEKMSLLPLTQIVASTTATVTNPEDARSISSYTTYGQKDPKKTSNNKRNARKSPTGDQEPDPRRLLILPQSSLPLISSSSSSSSKTILLLGAPPGFSSFGTPDDGPLTLSDTGNDRKFVADDASTVQIFNRAVGSRGGGFSFPDQPQQQQEQMQPLFSPRLGQQQEPQHHQQYIYPQDFIDMSSIISTFSSSTQEDHNNQNVNSNPRTTATTATNNITTTHPDIVPNNSSNLSMDGSTSGSPINTKLSRGGNPRSILNERYQKKYNHSFTKSDFISIKDTSNGDHVPQFTSVFVCPESGECFMSGELLISSGSFGSSTGHLDISKNDEINWYATKKTAEFAAAGRAEDNFYFRSSCSSAERLGHSSSTVINGIQQRFFCKEFPYYIAIDDEPNINIPLSSFLQEKFWDNGSTKEKVDKLIFKARRRDSRGG